MIPKTLLDSDVLSAVFRGHPTAAAMSRRYLGDHPQITFSVVSRYEVLRGLKAVRASTRLLVFERFCVASEIAPLTDPIIDRAADIYADLHRRGLLIGDADILIAASAIELGCDLATNNVAHFQRIPGLSLTAWI